MNLQTIIGIFNQQYLTEFVMILLNMENLLQDQMAVTGGFGNKKLNQKQIKDLKKKRNSNIVWMNDQWIYKEITTHTFTSKCKCWLEFSMGFGLNLVNLQNMKKVNIMIGIVIVGKNLMINQIHQDPHGKIRKLSVTVHYQTLKIIKVVN